ncbi:MAG: hypothetical protein CMJ94_14970 [Planctomycetes bacterium]|nr:hypothetical protein [Planctomycetota bacterium]
MPEIDSLSDLIPVFGRMHPLLLHLPIGMLVGLALLEIGNAIGRKPAASTFLVFFGAVTAAAAAASGLVLHEEPGYVESRVLELHEQLGLATAVCALVVFLLRAFGATTMYRWALLITVGVMIPTGHFGAEMVHGKNFLLEPLEQEEEPAPTVPTPSVEDGPTLASYEQHVVRFFQAKCNECHGDRKVKGGLRMDSPEALLAGGDGGPAIEEGVAPEDQELLYRMLLPIDDDDHMPPDHKAQPNEAEIELIRAWLLAGAPFDAEFELAEGAELPVTEAEPPASETGAQAQAPRAVPEAVLDSMRERLVHVQPVREGSNLLWVDFAAPASQVDDAMVRELLTPVVDWIADLSLARTQVTDTSLELIAVMPQLERLDLRGTAVTTAGLQQLVDHPHLRELVVSRTKLDDAATSALQRLPALEHLWIWDAGLSAEAIEGLRAALPEVVIDAGDLGDSAMLETEEKPEFTSDAPPVDAPSEAEIAAAEALAQKPTINQVCLVSGKEIDPQFNLEHNGQVIGFCCPNCPKTFLADPDKFLAKLESSDG